VDLPTFRRRWLEERQWDLVQVQWEADVDPDETLYQVNWGAGKWVNKDFDRAVKSARTEADQKKRKKFYDDAVKAILADSPVTIVLHANEQKVFGKHVKDFQMIPLNLIDMHKVWLDRA
jgi:ABC-type transport system substrate-binding protein